MTDSNTQVQNPQTQETAKPLVVAISSRALFDLDESHSVFESEGLEAYAEYQISRENEFLKPGEAFQLVKKLLALNADETNHQGVEVILVSRNSADSGLRIFNSIEHHDLDIERAVFTNGESRFRYMKAIGTDLFLSSHAEDVRKALNAGFASAMILAGAQNKQHRDQLRVAFDGDAVLFSDEAEKVYQAEGLEAFSEREKQRAETPLPDGPFKPLMQALQNIQSAYPIENNPIRTALVTARSAPAHKRVILTLREWGIRVDEALFLGGKPKGPFLAAFGADIFFDDQQIHCDSAREHVATGHVPSGVRNP
ncbi:MAG: 5'-nucleotidase [Xanthomonadales bacterium]|nr:5'-nucleotidase [Xanthomonadales bacterium]